MFAPCPGYRTAITAALMLCAPVLRSQTPIVIYSFKVPAADGNSPLAGVAVDGSGNLYGTTAYGGPSDDGLAYELAYVNGSWQFIVLHPFAGGATDGDGPTGSLLLVGTGVPVVYGTTVYGGSANHGVAFELTSVGAGAWSESVLHDFTDTDGDGSWPAAGLIERGGVLYGTTCYGGDNQRGTVYSLTSGSASGEQVVYRFAHNTDGFKPCAPLFSAGSGVFYGTTERGGAHGYGTVFELNHAHGAWTERCFIASREAATAAIPNPVSLWTRQARFMAPPGKVEPMGKVACISLRRERAGCGLRTSSTALARVRRMAPHPAPAWYSGRARTYSMARPSTAAASLPSAR